MVKNHAYPNLKASSAQAEKMRDIDPGEISTLAKFIAKLRTFSGRRLAERHNETTIGKAVTFHKPLFLMLILAADALATRHDPGARKRGFIMRTD